MNLPALLEREPVRLYLYGLAVPLVALLVGTGVLDSDASSLWLGIAAAVLAVPSVEGARARVTPWHPEHAE